MKFQFVVIHKKGQIPIPNLAVLQSTLRRFKGQSVSIKYKNTLGKADLMSITVSETGIIRETDGDKKMVDWTKFSYSKN